MSAQEHCWVDPDDEGLLVTRPVYGFTSEQARRVGCYQGEPADDGVRMAVASVTQAVMWWPALDDKTQAPMSHVLASIACGPFDSLSTAYDVSVGLVDRQGDAASVLEDELGRFWAITDHDLAHLEGMAAPAGIKPDVRSSTDG